MSRSNNTFIDFDGTLVLQNSSRVLMEVLMRRAVTRPERLTARLLGGPARRVAHLGLELAGRVTGDRDVALVLVLLAFRKTFAANHNEIIAEAAGKLTLNGSLAHVYRRPFSIASAGLRPVIRAFLEQHPGLAVETVYCSELTMDGAKLNLRLLTMRGKLRALRTAGADSYFTDYDREARLFERRQPGAFDVTVVPGEHDNTIFHLEGRS